MRRAGAAVLAAVLALTLAGCGRQDRPQSGKLNVVCTLFPYYDFVRQIGGDAVEASCGWRTFWTRQARLSPTGWL